ncbi:MAG: SUMF1/EgtB/PvdO family nonheme iron enzyme [Deltaproteobacteria bacterium]|nr:SUMF1/EgtB/PvdO family nonheme iron enzyme [Deltaproteobacteria bacterium]
MDTTDVPTDGADVADVPDVPDVPVDAPEVPADVEDIPVDVEDAPTDAEDIPVDVEDVPTETEDVPTDAEDVPTDAEDVPTDVEDVPTDVEDVPTDVEADVEEDTVDADADVVDGEGGLAPCPADMVPAGAVCIDRYEASRSDATATSAGIDETTATSRPGVIPWFVWGVNTTLVATFEAACAAAGKRLCWADEWQAACRGPGDLSHVYGPTFDRETCNCVDTFCDDYCETHSIEPAACDVAPDCGYRYYCFHVVPTGAFPGCTNELGTYDINGNVWEIVRSTVDTRGFEIRGGAFNCAWAEYRVNCTFNAGWVDLNGGFRCCKDR